MGILAGSSFPPSLITAGIGPQVTTGRPRPFIVRLQAATASGRMAKGVWRTASGLAVSRATAMNSVLIQ